MISNQQGDLYCYAQLFDRIRNHVMVPFNALPPTLQYYWQSVDTMKYVENRFIITCSNFFFILLCVDGLSFIVEKSVSKPDGKLIRNMGVNANVEIIFPMYQGLYLLIQNPNLFDSKTLPSLMQFDKMHTETFFEDLIYLKTIAIYRIPNPHIN